ncbi:MAG TPA: peptide ABC transporter permease, partial [Gemmatimonadetes bacterium]|nr:peptide ABC transporter permease [Gemmatimonadota bacterium]
MKTHEFIVRRIILLVPVMIGVTVFTFGISQIIPADPAAILCAERCGLVDPTTGMTLLELQRERLGLNKPIIEQF